MNSNKMSNEKIKIQYQKEIDLDFQKITKLQATTSMGGKHIPTNKKYRLTFDSMKISIENKSLSLNLESLIPLFFVIQFCSVHVPTAEHQV